MILDDLIAVIVSSIASLVEGVAILFVSIINLFICGIELVVGLFVAGFKIRRIGRPPKRADPAEGHRTPPPSKPRIIAAVSILAILFAIPFLPGLLKRQITLVAEDGHSLPFAAVIVTTGHGDEHQRTDNSGNFRVPRFGLKAVAVRDSRYVDQTWESPDIASTLVASRSVVGKGLDAVLGKLLRSAGDE